MTLSLQQRCTAIELLVVDVDGVLTDGRIIYSEDGRETKAFHVRDGAALKCWHQAGKRSAILSARQSATVDRRAAELGVTRVVQGAQEKLAAFQQLVADEELQMAQVCYVGDDLPDVPVLRASGLAVAVADACLEARAEAHYVTGVPGGQGAVREVVELILKCQGRWQAIVDRMRTRGV